MRPVDKKLCLWLMLSLLAPLQACSGGSEQARQVVVIPSGLPGEAGEEEQVVACPDPGTCRVLDEPALPLRRSHPGESERVAAQLQLGEELFLAGDLARASTSLEAGFSLVKARPELLPGEPGQRGRIYQSLLALYQLRQRRGGDADELGLWMARSLPDVSPTVLSAPPAVEAALSRSSRVVAGQLLEISVEGVQARERCGAFLDGRELGSLPLGELKVPRGLHGIQVRCGDGWESLVRIIPEDAVRVSLRVEPGVDDLLVPDSGRFRVASEGPEARRAALALVKAAGADAGVFFPPGDKAPELLVLSPRFFTRLEPGEGGSLELNPQDFQPPLDWKVPAALSSAALGAAALGFAVVTNWYHDQAVAELNKGWKDNRSEINYYYNLSLSGYVAAGVLAAVSGSLTTWMFLSGPGSSLSDPIPGIRMDFPPAP